MIIKQVIRFEATPFRLQVIENKTAQSRSKKRAQKKGFLFFEG
jgi:hypothetical protein